MIVLLIKFTESFKVGIIIKLSKNRANSNFPIVWYKGA